MFKVGDRRLQTPPVGGKLPRLHGEKRLRSQRIAGGRERREHQHGKLRKPRVERVLAQAQLRRLSGHETALHERLRVLAKAQQRSLDRLVHPRALAEKHRRVRAQVVQRADAPRLDQREIAVGAVEGEAVLKPLRVRAERFGKVRPVRLFFGLFRKRLELFRKRRRAALGRGGQRLRRGEEDRLLHVLHAPLRRGVEYAHRVDLVVEELAAHGHLRRGREHVQNPAAHGELSRALHLLAARVARGNERFGNAFEVGALADGKPHRPLPQRLRGDGARHERLRRGDEHARLPLREGTQRRKALLLPLAGGDRAGAQVPLPRGQDDRLVARERGEVGGQRARLPLVPADEHGAPLRRPCDRRAHAGALHGLQSRHGGGAGARLHAAHELRDLADFVQFFQKLPQNPSLRSRNFKKSRRSTQERAHSALGGRGVPGLFTI